MGIKYCYIKTSFSLSATISFLSFASLFMGCSMTQKQTICPLIDNKFATELTVSGVLFMEDTSKTKGALDPLLIQINKVNGKKCAPIVMPAYFCMDDDKNMIDNSLNKGMTFLGYEDLHVSGNPGWLYLYRESIQERGYLIQSKFVIIKVLSDE